MANNGVPATGKGLIVSFGEMLIDFVPTESGVSLAEAPAFLKAPAAFVGKLGDDEFGHMLAGILKQYGVTRRGHPLRSGRPHRPGLRDPTRRRRARVHAKVFHYGSISLIVEPCRSAHLKAMEVAKDAGALLSYDPNLRLPLWPSAEEARKQIMSIWEKADLIKISDVELEFLTGNPKIDDENALTLWKDNLKLLLVTLGEKGCRYYTKHFRGSVEAFHVKTVDTTGAGDSFVGALLAKIVDDQSILEDEQRLRGVLKFANACGAITTTKKGAIPALPSESEAFTLIKGA
ncbi:pfkB-like carbohydrate kinase family protein [Prunus dulcis]|uniref:PfkB-like carbohydrate kinase family protein n=1 Tax=Prunus dulcis TaxID=3755 RepID=A0A5H2XN16_PRUDU|nr:pfkB-like carbohydrate kinase family protein [Prunus dulcis]